MNAAVRTSATSLLAVAIAAASASCARGAPAAGVPVWGLGPFNRPADAAPVIRPNPESRFICPLRGAQVAWEALHTFNPAAVVRDGMVYVLYRAEDDTGLMRVGGHTSRLGLATSRDGVTFVREPGPVLFPAADDQTAHEWTGGCEDPRIAESPDGNYVMTYTQYNGAKFRLGIATSPDLRTWTKHGSAFSGTEHEQEPIKSGAILHSLTGGRLIAARVNGFFWMYVGEVGRLAKSRDLIHWTLVTGSDGRPLVVLPSRPHYHDSDFPEIGPQALLTARGIVVLYNAKNSRGPLGDASLPGGVYTCGQALFDAADPARLIDRTTVPFFKPELVWEKSGQYRYGTTFIEGLVYFKHRWMLYYGCADTFVGVAMTPPSPSTP